MKIIDWDTFIPYHHRKCENLKNMSVKLNVDHKSSKGAQLCEDFLTKSST